MFHSFYSEGVLISEKNRAELLSALVWRAVNKATVQGFWTLLARIIWGTFFKYQLLSLINSEWSVCVYPCVFGCWTRVCAWAYVSVCARACMSLCVHTYVYAMYIFPCTLICSCLASTIFRTMKCKSLSLVKRDWALWRVAGSVHAWVKQWSSLAPSFSREKVQSDF